MLTPAPQRSPQPRQKDHVGETRTVCGNVVSTHYGVKSKGQPTFLNLDELQSAIRRFTCEHNIVYSARREADFVMSSVIDKYPAADSPVSLSALLKRGGGR